MELISDNNIALKEVISKHATGSVNYWFKKSEISLLASWTRKSKQKSFLNYDKSIVINIYLYPCHYYLTVGTPYIINEDRIGQII
jgi:hypothetical protein